MLRERQAVPLGRKTLPYSLSGGRFANRPYEKSLGAWKVPKRHFLPAGKSAAKSQIFHLPLGIWSVAGSLVDGILLGYHMENGVRVEPRTLDRCQVPGVRIKS